MSWRSTQVAWQRERERERKRERERERENPTTFLWTNNNIYRYTQIDRQTIREILDLREGIE